MALITLIRHGQASFGTEDYDRLSPLGERQARFLGQSLRERQEQVDAVWAGGLRRHQATANICLEAMGLSLPVRTSRDFDELDHEQIHQRYVAAHGNREPLSGGRMSMFKAALDRWANGDWDNDYDEPWSQFQNRCCRGLGQVAATVQGKERVLVFTSGGVISVIVQALMGLDNHHAIRVNWTLTNASATNIRTSSRGENYVLSLNEHDCFKGKNESLLTWYWIGRAHV